MRRKPGPPIYYPAKMAVSFLQEDYDELKRIANQKHMYMTEVLREALRDYIQKHNKQPEWYDPNQ